jgi:hypothetical protein
MSPLLAQRDIGFRAILTKRTLSLDFAVTLAKSKQRRTVSQRPKYMPKLRIREWPQR